MTELVKPADCGVCYLFSGVGFAERLAVALFTLREHYHGAVTVFCTDELCLDVGRRLAGSLEVTIREGTLAQARRHQSYLTKTFVPEWTDYKHTVFIDADTVVVAPFEELFGPSLVITRFSDWVSNARRVPNRLKWWRGKSPAIDAMIDVQISATYPAINTGVMGWQKGNPAMAQWHALTAAGAGTHMTDELAMQMLHTHVECQVVDDRFNCSPIYGTPEGRADARIWHFHGSKHLRKEPGRSMWLSHWERTFMANPGGLRDWAGKYDPDVARLLQ